MKLQHLAVIFILIIIPISIITSEYLHTQIGTINLQTKYTNILNKATSDSLKAYEINSINNKYSNLSDSKIRDIEASINTFYNSLGSSVNNYISTKEDLSSFVPAILFNLYDGYYIYSAYNNVYSTTGVEKNKRVKIDSTTKNYQNGLRPYIYYSCQYKVGSENIIVNYTLDNAITIYGNLDFDSDGDKEYGTRAGYLIDYRKVSGINKNNKKLIYDGVEIAPESLTEHLITIENPDEGTVIENDYSYIVYQNKKVYKDTANETTKIPLYDGSGKIITDSYGNISYHSINAPKFFWYDNNKKTYLKSEKVDFIKYLTDNNLYKISGNNLVTDIGFKSISAYEYYIDAYNFSKWLVEKSGLRYITQSNIIKNNGSQVGTGEIYLSTNTEGKYIFDTTKTGNDPLVSTSTFNEHRRAVIRKSIETNLTTAIANYNAKSLNTYEFAMPIIDEESWEKITNKVSVVSFMQGIPISQKYYNSYSVITNVNNEEVVNEQSVYVLVKNDDGNYEYHQPGCKELINKLINGKATNPIAYTSLNFKRQTVKVNEVRTLYFYPQARVNKTTTGCYNCIINASGDYDIDSIILGEVRDYQTGNILYNSNQLKSVRQSYLRGLARERNDLYKSNFD